ncbi:hypothetical protein V6N13_095308 [Hibiscus sabdariffa]
MSDHLHALEISANEKQKSWDIWSEPFSSSKKQELMNNIFEGIVELGPGNRGDEGCLGFSCLIQTGLSSFVNYSSVFLDNASSDLEKAVTRSFMETDAAFAKSCSLESSLPSGTTVLTAMVFGKSLLVANAGDSRAVLSWRGTAIERFQRIIGPVA